MARSSNQKLKLTYLIKILSENTDKDNFISMELILELLSHYGITAERKSVYEDIQLLRFYGFDIQLVRKKGYHLASRTFELAELKLLVDAVQASKFITIEKSNELIKKLEGLTSKHQAKNLQHSVIMRERIKTMNESVYINVDIIHQAIAENKQITFKYFDWNMKKQRVFRKEGALYNVSPRALTWDDENYYLLGYDASAQMTKHYRVDKMADILILDTPCTGIDTTLRFDTANYSKKMFGMFGGETKKVKLRCHESLAGVFIDRFGTGIIIAPDGQYFEVIVEVAVSPVFLSWLIQFGDRVTVISPQSVKDDIIKLCSTVLDANK